ncbi:hypothetical protein Tcan_14621 [Toxocara canis]|uniref:Uncharacterized protein n=1 Tax=Toxocara canis TaxID=6265 RepID=A0A0B2VI06_TOXCA|nr:hypothetical protein Tcan_14621 [Toxocara canis]
MVSFVTSGTVLIILLISLVELVQFTSSQPRGLGGWSGSSASSWSSSSKGAFGGSSASAVASKTIASSSDYRKKEMNARVESNENVNNGETNEQKRFKITGWIESN